jgi:hypothetical protein
MIETLSEMLASLQGKLHCWLIHGAGGPARDTHFGHIEIFCPICGRVFWHDHKNAEAPLA